MNKGKIFEQNFRKSVPENIFYYRLKDSAVSWGENNKTRFSPSNVCDSILFDGYNLYLIELKNHKGKSLPLNCIRDKQLKELGEYSKYKNVKSCIIINFEELEECYCLFIDQIREFIELGSRKSISFAYCQENAVKIDLVKLRTNYRYDVGKFIESVNK